MAAGAGFEPTSCCGARNSLLAVRFAEFRPLPLARLPPPATGSGRLAPLRLFALLAARRAHNPVCIDADAVPETQKRTTTDWWLFFFLVAGAGFEPTVRVGAKASRCALLATSQVPAQLLRSLDSAAGGAPSKPSGYSPFGLITRCSLMQVQFL